jgi:hypothetical protein
MPISGKDSLATAILQTGLYPELDYEYVYNPTGLELPEVFVWLDKVEKYFGKKITRVGEDLKKIIKDNNYFLPSQKARYCTRQAKIEPFVEWLGGEPCTVYYGIRADENRGGFDNSAFPNIIPNNPLQEHNIDLKGVYLILNSKGLKPPVFYWEALHEKVTRILGYDPKSRIPEWAFDMLFAWRSRANCDRCFNQRQYEWVGLLLFYPDLFWDAEGMEHLGSTEFKRKSKEEKDQLIMFSEELMVNITEDDLEGMFTWNGNKVPLKDITKRARKIFQNRAEQVASTIIKMVETKLFKDEADEEIIDTLSITSCGLMCGK